MAQVEIKINGKSYRIACEDGQEDRLRDLAATVDSHVRDLVSQVGQIGDTRLLVMAALLITDELMDLRDSMETLRGDGGSAADGERVAASIEALAARIDTIADRLRPT